MKTPTINEEDLALLRTRCDELLAENLRLQRDKRRLEQRLQDLLRRLYGPRADRFDPNQLGFDFGDEPESPPPPLLDDTPDDESGSGDHDRRKKRRHHGRNRIPEHLPTEEVLHDIPEEDRVCPCCDTPLDRIGQEVTDELEYRPASYLRRLHIRPKYACRKCQDGPLICDMPVRPVDKGRPGPGLLAQIVTAKYCDHLPLHRQRGIMLRHGIDMSVSTLSDWVAHAARLLEPIHRFLRQRVLSSPVVQSDDTRVLLQRNSKKGKTQRAFLWAYLAESGEVAFDFTTSRKKIEPQRFLKGFTGRYLQTDAYVGYEDLCDGEAIRAVGCWAHARRRFVAAMADQPQEASVALASIRRIYKIDREAREQGLTAGGLAEVRQAKSKPILDALGEYLKALKPHLLEKSKLADAVGYTLNQWGPLTRFLEDGRLELDNNRAERTMRHVAVGRKNWVFCGSEEGGRRIAIIYSVVVTCKLAGIDVFAYLCDYFSRVATHPANRLEELTPLGWQAARASPPEPG